MTHLSVSVIVPVFNGERFLAEAIESVLAQAYHPLEIIVVDDGSTDGTGEIAHRFADQISYLRQPNCGPAAARMEISSAFWTTTTFGLQASWRCKRQCSRSHRPS